MSAHAKNRTHEDKLRHLERAVRKFGDSDGKRAEALERLTSAPRIGKETRPANIPAVRK